MLKSAMLAALAGLGLLGLLGACNEHDPHPPNSTDPGNSFGGGAGASPGATTTAKDGGTDSGATGLVDAGACTNLEDSSTVIDENAVSDNAPAGVGGDLAGINATYDLQTASKYVGATGQAGPNGVTYREVIRITGAAALERNRAIKQNNGPEQLVNASYVLQVSGTTTLTLTQRCPSQGGSESYAFTLQNGKLTLTSTLGESFTYVARP